MRFSVSGSGSGSQHNPPFQNKFWFKQIRSQTTCFPLRGTKDSSVVPISFTTIILSLYYIKKTPKSQEFLCSFVKVNKTAPTNFHTARDMASRAYRLLGARIPGISHAPFRLFYRQPRQNSLTDIGKPAEFFLSVGKICSKNAHKSNEYKPRKNFQKICRELSRQIISRTNIQLTLFLLDPNDNDCDNSHHTRCYTDDSGNGQTAAGRAALGGSRRAACRGCAVVSRRGA